MEHHVPLLRGGGDKIVQAFPVFQIPGPDNSAGGHGGGFIAFRSGGILAFGTEETVDPAVFVAGEAHVVDIGVPLGKFRKKDRLFTEPEAVDAGFGVGDGKEGFAVVAFHPADKRNFPVPFDRARIENRVDAKTLHKPGIRRRIEVELPPRGDHFRRQNRIHIPVESAVVPVGIDRVLPGDKRFVALKHPRFFCFKIIHFFHISCLQNSL